MVSPSAVVEIGKRLRAAREASGRTLEDLAASTRINQSFLQEIEEGRQPGVPDIYFRAFVKTFAAEVGERADELLEMMTSAAAPSAPSAASAPPPPSASAPAAPLPAAARTVPSPDAPPPPDGQRSGPEVVRRQAKILVGLAFMVIVGLIMSVYWLRNEKSEKGIQEISFADVVKEQTAKLQPRDSAAALPADTGKKPAGLTARTAAAKGDSLILQAVTSETVWVHIEFDGGAASEYTLPPGYRIQWKAARQFSVSIGNPSGMTFILDGKPLGKLSEGKKPIRNHIISRASLDAH